MVLQRGLEPRLTALRAVIIYPLRSKNAAHLGVRASSASPGENENRANGKSRQLCFGAPAGTRTPDTLLKRQVLYLLSYWGILNCE